MIVYSVWCEGTGDIFKGYDNKYISSHLDRNVANRVASINSGWVECENDNLHPDYEASLREQDRNLREVQLSISASVRDMLAYGG